MVTKKNVKEIQPALKDSALPEALIKDEPSTSIKPFPKKRVRFLKRCDYDTNYIDFTMTKSGIVHHYKLYDGQVYDLPEDVIQYLSGIVSVERYTKYGSDQVEEYKKVNYQFDYLE